MNFGMIMRPLLRFDQRRDGLNRTRNTELISGKSNSIGKSSMRNSQTVSPDLSKIIHTVGSIAPKP